MEKEGINIVIQPEDYTKDLENILNKVFNIGKILSFKEVIELEVKRKSGEEKIQRFFPDVVIFGNNTNIDFKIYFETEFTEAKLDKKKAIEADTIFKMFNKRIPKFGFGNGATFLALANGCKLLFDVENHNKPHETTFMLNSFETISYPVNSNHNTIMYPINMNRNSYRIKAFSTYNNSLIYYDSKQQPIKVPYDFVEPEIIHFSNTNSCAFQYNVPSSEEKVIFNLTLEYFK